MRIACTGNAWLPESAGGLDKYLYGLAHEFTRGGDDVDYFVTGNPLSWDGRARTFSIGDPQAPLPLRLLSARRAYARHYAEPYDVANLHFALFALPLLPYVDRRTAKVVHFHGPWSEESRAEGGSSFTTAIKARLERYLYRSADRFVVLSGAFRDILCDSYGIDPTRVSVIPMGIDTEVFSPASVPRAKAAAAGDRPFVVFTARRLVRRVGVLELVEAAAILKSAGVPVEIRIAGSGPLEAELRERTEAAGLGDVVRLLGFIDEETLVEEYRRADLTFLPTQSLEGFGTIISESLACGTPAAGTPIGGIPAAIGDFDDRLLAASAEPAAIAELLSRIVRGDIILPEAERCRSYAVETYAWPTVAARVREVFRTAKAEHRERLGL